VPSGIGSRNEPEPSPCAATPLAMAATLSDGLARAARPGPDTRPATAFGARQMVLGLLRCLWLPASCADGDCAADHPLGPRCFKRCVATIGPLLQMRSQGARRSCFQAGLARRSVLRRSRSALSARRQNEVFQLSDELSALNLGDVMQFLFQHRTKFGNR